MGSGCEKARKHLPKYDRIIAECSLVYLNNLSVVTLFMPVVTTIKLISWNIYILNNLKNFKTFLDENRSDFQIRTAVEFSIVLNKNVFGVTHGYLQFTKSNVYWSSKQMIQFVSAFCLAPHLVYLIF